MTGIEAMSPSFNRQWTYDVFINFRGEDTRHGFTGYLYDALKKATVRTFFDDEEIRGGDEIAPTLIKAIENSRMAITVFSKNYASSTFCLNELVKIHECIKRKGRLVLPVFYGVEPSEVRYQKGNYEQALSMHIENFRADEDRIQSWKLALQEVANISGHHFVHGQNRYEYQFIEKIVKEISNKINRVPLQVCDYPIGLKTRLKEINSLLRIESNEEAIMVGICGMGGLGKSTLARALYNSVADNFEDLCFINDVKETSMRVGLNGIQKTILSDIGVHGIEIQDVSEGVGIMKRRCKEKKILLILDDVDNHDQLKNLAGGCNWFSGGSRIVVTTRDKHLLERHGIESTYDMGGFNDNESLELLRRNTFKAGQQVDSSFKDVLNRAVSYAQGLPLALEIIGANLYGMSTSEWESALDLYERIPEENILQRLKVSYDCLDPKQQDIFLDIACFFIGEEFQYAKFVEERVNGFNPEYVFRVLENKCLIKFVKNLFGGDVIVMHDLIRDMGRDIVRKESPNKPGEWSRLWVDQDIVDVLEENTGTDRTRMIVMGRGSYLGKVVNWDGEGFKYMKGLEVLIIENGRFSAGPKSLPNSLKVLTWRNYPHSDLPPLFYPKKLVHFDLRGDGWYRNHLRSLESIKTASNLVVLNVEYCGYVREIPDLLNLQKLKELKLGNCMNLIEIHASIGYLRKLEVLDVSYCDKLKTIPRAFKSPSLRQLSLYGCMSLKYFPEILENVDITCLDISCTGIDKLPWSICNLTKLTDLCIYQSKLVFQIPSCIFLLPQIELININCKEGKVFQAIRPNKHDPSRVIESTLFLPRCNISDALMTTYLSRFINVQHLDLSSNPITILPTWFTQCHLLHTLILNDCRHLREVKGIPPNIYRLEAINCTSLSADPKTLLLCEEVHGDPYDLYEEETNCFCVSSRSIPEWFEHTSKGACISFWVHISFPPLLCLCFLFKSQDNVLYSYDHHNFNFESIVFINGESVDNFDMPSFGFNVKQFDGHHLVVYHLIRDRIIDADDIERDEWIHVEVEVTGNDGVDIKESGMYVIKQHFDMQHISFHNPYESSDSTSSAQVNLFISFMPLVIV